MKSKYLVAPLALGLSICAFASQEKNEASEAKLEYAEAAQEAKFEEAVAKERAQRESKMTDEERKAYREERAKLHEAAANGDTKAQARLAEMDRAHANESGLIKKPGELSGKESPEQSAARPYDLDIAAPVQVAASDKASEVFQKESLPGMLELVQKSLGESQSKDLKAVGAMAFDPSKLVLSEDATARVYFLTEGAGYLNSLGYSTTGGSPLDKSAALIFPNASSNGEKRTGEEPLLPGDFVDLGTFKAGTALDFFLIANGAIGGKEIYSTNDSLNEDGLVHVVSFALPGSPYLIIGFEDLRGGGDRDFNDLVFAIDIGKANIDKLTALGAPEPSLAAGALFAAVGLLGFSRRRK